MLKPYQIKLLFMIPVLAIFLSITNTAQTKPAPPYTPAAQEVYNKGHSDAISKIMEMCDRGSVMQIFLKDSNGTRYKLTCALSTVKKISAKKD